MTRRGSCRSCADVDPQRVAGFNTVLGEERRPPMASKIAVDRDAIADFCRKHQIRRLAFFGSVLRDDFSPDSDIDVLVEFEPGRRIGLIGMSKVEIELSSLLGRKADLRTAPELSRYFRDEVLAEAEEQYAKA